MLPQLTKQFCKEDYGEGSWFTLGHSRPAVFCQKMKLTCTQSPEPPAPSAERCKIKAILGTRTLKHQGRFGRRCSVPNLHLQVSEVLLNLSKCLCQDTRYMKWAIPLILTKEHSRLQYQAVDSQVSLSHLSRIPLSSRNYNFQIQHTSSTAERWSQSLPLSAKLSPSVLPSCNPLRLFYALAQNIAWFNFSY